jgi:FlaA1/EpsC-like NDP-sugar epimerase
VLFHLAVVGVSNYLAFWLRFDGDIPPSAWAEFTAMLPWLLAIRGVSFVPFRVYEGLWRYTSTGDLRNLIGGVAMSSAVFYVVVRWRFGATGYPRSVFVMDALLLIFLLGGARLLRRVCRALGWDRRRKRMLVYGAGDAGEMIVRDMLHTSFHGYKPVAFVDDNRAKVGTRIHGVKVLGTREDIARVMARTKPDAVLIAMPRATPSTVRSIVRALEGFKVPIQTVPNLRDILDGKVTVSQIRTLSVEDLLERAPVGLDNAGTRLLIEGRRVLVTGAGGSIGSELARQIIRLAPKSLVLLDRYENGLHAINTELSALPEVGAVTAVVGDVTDEARVAEILSFHHPEIVFHAAAHKHVPLMEINPCEAVKNNVRGTRVLAEAALRFGVERFVLISTDKAVNPVSVMGATKRAAELFVQSMNGRGRCVFTAVRFGNVLASNGSVVPHFLEQIRSGGPVTVTHADVRRYFMLIPEAVHLVLHAAALATGDDLFVLEMGEPVRVLDLARNLIRLSGFVSDEEIPITFIGLRAGERLEEELVGQDEITEESGVKGVLRLRARTGPSLTGLTEKLAAAEAAAAAGRQALVIERLREVVPTYRPAGMDS